MESIFAFGVGMVGAGTFYLAFNLGFSVITGEAGFGKLLVFLGMVILLYNSPWLVGIFFAMLANHFLPTLLGIIVSSWLYGQLS